MLLLRPALRCCWRPPHPAEGTTLGHPRWQAPLSAVQAGRYSITGTRAFRGSPPSPFASAVAGPIVDAVATPLPFSGGSSSDVSAACPLLPSALSGALNIRFTSSSHACRCVYQP